MDYLVFAIGLLLISAAVGAALLHRDERRAVYWPLMGVALVALAVVGWADLVWFASKAASPLPWLRGTMGALAVAGFGSFAVWRPVGNRRRGAALVAVVVAALVAFGCGGVSDRSPGLWLPALVAAFAAGWRCGSLSGRSRSWAGTCGLCFAWVTMVELRPGMVAAAYDVNGAKDAWPRMLMLTALALGAVAALIVAWIFAHLQAGVSRRSGGRRPGVGSRILIGAFLLTLAYGAWLTHWLGHLVLDEQRTMLLSAMQLGASALDPADIVQVRGKPEEVVGQPFLTQHRKLIQIRDALPKTRYVYLVGQREGHVVFLVDAEDPASPDFSPPGMAYEYQAEKWLRALKGEAHFGGPDADPWGVWFTAILPVESPGGVVAALGVDYPARDWLQPMASRRLAAMGVNLSVGCLLLALLAFNVIASEKNRKVDDLSERLSDAMDTAELDTWEWIPAAGQVTVGPRLGAALGYRHASQILGLKQVWRRIHPAERARLRRLMKRPQTGPQGSSDTEIRLVDASGRATWFMVRGRLIESADPQLPPRMTGTILNIDESYRGRLEIERQRRLAQRVMESVPTGIAVVTPGGRIRYANAALIELAGLRATEVEERPLRELIPQADELGPQGQEVSLVHENGEAVWVQAFRAELHESDEEAGSLVSLVDLTSIKRTEQELKQSRAEARRLALVAKRTDNAVVITDRHGRIEWVNEAFTRISGYSREEVMGRTPGSVLAGEESDRGARDHMRERVQAGMGFDTEIVNYAKDGRRYLVHIECQPLLDRQGELTGFMAIERDITRARRSSRLLEAGAEISTTLLSASRMTPELWAAIIERLGLAAGVERSYLVPCGAGKEAGEELAPHSLTGWSSERVRALLPDLPRIDFAGSGFPRWRAQLAAGIEVAGAVEDFPAAEQAWLRRMKIKLLLLVPVFVGDAFWGFMGFDVCTEARQWEDWEITLLKSTAANIGLRLVAEQESDALRTARDEARQAADAAERANRAKSTFLATMSHEIRTPLNAVIGMASLLETTPLSPLQREHAETILRSSHFLLEIINDILDYSRIESGRIELDQSPFRLAELCKEAFDIVKAGAIGKPLEVICRLDPDLPGTFTGDPARLRQVLVNLLGNAIKFTPEGFVSLTVAGAAPATAEGPWRVDFQVADSGIGIAADSVERLFKPFIQEDSSTTRRFGGSGLGLAISQRLARLMNGDITVTSRQGEGSVFHFSVELAGAAEAETLRARPTRLPAGWNPRLLVVDDNEMNLRVLTEILAGMGLRGQIAAGAAEALQIWRERGPFDVVLTDHRMPVMSGVELTRQLRGLPGAEGCKFVLLGSDSAYGAEARELFDSQTTKPVWPASIAALLAGLYPSPAAAVPATVPESGEGLAGLRMLVAEDNPNNQKVIRLLLRQLGIDPELVNDGSQAVAAVRQRPYDVVLMDVQMPVMDGLEASRQLKEAPPAHRPYIIALTANAFREDREAALAAGMDAYLAKPVTLAGLRDALTFAARALTPPATRE